MTLNWTTYYNSIKGIEWPNCDREEDIGLLPDWVKTELATMGYDFSNRLRNYEVFTSSGKHSLKVFYSPELDGGGTTYGQEFIELIKARYPGVTFERCFDWCSGPGFIGISILDHELAKSICLVDCWEPAIAFAEYSILENNLTTVTPYLLKDISLLPEHEMFDLVVGVPPSHQTAHHVSYHDNRITADVNWLTHKNFFKNIKKHLSPNGVILLQEHRAGSKQSDFESFILDAGLKITDHFYSKQCNYLYYLEIKHENLS